LSFDLLTVFGAGLLTFVTPCVLPLIPIYLAALVGGDVRDLGAKSRGRLVSRAALFALGFVAVFTAMGVGASSIGGFFADHRAGLQLLGAGLVLGFALKFLGVIQIPWLDQTARADENKLRTRFGGINAAVMGVVFAAGWSPCVGPVLGSVLTYTASNAASPALGGLYLSVYGLGFALPLLLIAAFADAGLRALGRIKPHLPRIEKATGALLLLVAGLLVHDAATGWDDATKPIVADAAAAETLPANTAPEQAALLDAADPVPPPPASAAPASQPLPLMVELYAEECPICQRMKPLVDGLIRQCDQKKVRVRTVDVSKPENRHFIRQYRVVGVPTFLFLDDRGQEVARLVGEQTEGTLMQALAALRGEECPGLGRLPAGDHTRAEEIAMPGQDEPAAACGAAPAGEAMVDEAPGRAPVDSAAPSETAPACDPL
jgi:cytochrome c-type biogenesis protein